MQKSTLLFLLLLPLSSIAQSDSTATTPAIPQWLLEDWAEQAKGSGIWITDNSAYENENEPFDEYGIQWEFGLGEKSLKGRLFCMQAGKDVGTVWQFLSFWDPLKQQARLIQIGSDGTLGEGHLWRLDDGSNKTIQTFASPDGSTFTSGHHEWTENGERHTQSYSVQDTVWIKRRFYIWKRSNQ